MSTLTLSTHRGYSVRQWGDTAVVEDDAGRPRAAVAVAERAMGRKLSTPLDHARAEAIASPLSPLWGRPGGPTHLLRWPWIEDERPVNMYGKIVIKSRPKLYVGNLIGWNVKIDDQAFFCARLDREEAEERALRLWRHKRNMRRGHELLEAKEGD